MSIENIVEIASGIRNKIKQIVRINFLLISARSAVKKTGNKHIPNRIIKSRMRSSANCFGIKGRRRIRRIVRS